MVIDRETGEFVLYNSRFRLDVRGNQAFLFDYLGKEPLFSAYLQGTLWRFEEQEYVRENEDPYVAAIQVLYDVIRYC